jgi:lysophospholipase L1-like esterase
MFALKDGQTILFAGDSITDCGRSGPHSPYGDGYVALFRELLITQYPEQHNTIINKGIGGNTVHDLAGRWEVDVLNHRPEWLAVKIGINDLHRTLHNPDEGIPPKAFAKTYESILQRAVDAWSPGLILISPFYISRDFDSGSFESSVLELIPQYIGAVERLATQFGARYVPLHDIFQTYLETREPDEFCPEPVHPNRLGHLVIAQAVFAAMEP